LAACDLFTIELMTPHGLVRCTLFFVIELATRKVGMRLLNFNLTVITCGTSASGGKQVARLLADSEDGFLKKDRFLIHDRDPLFTEEFWGAYGDNATILDPPPFCSWPWWWP
jgi:hypothetical protein